MSLDLFRQSPTNGSAHDEITGLPQPHGDDKGDMPDDCQNSAGEPQFAVDWLDATSPPRDYPAPLAITDKIMFDWYEDRPPAENYVRLSSRIQKAGVLYCRTDYAGGLLFAPPYPHVVPSIIEDTAVLSVIINDLLNVRVVKGGNFKGWGIPTQHLKIVTRSEAFLQGLLPVDRAVTKPFYLPDFSLTRPDYNDGGYGQRVLYHGDEPWIEFNRDTMNRFLDVMDFESVADRTHSVAGALTVMLGNHWAGGKPCLVVTISKSHGGKDTIDSFMAGNTPHASVSYGRTNWAIQKEFVASVGLEPDLGLINIENARLDRGEPMIAWAFLERFITDKAPILYSPGTKKPVRRENDIIVAFTTNDGTVSEDLLNRALCVHVNPIGDVADRVTPIGNPKLEYLPTNHDRIEAELRGMIERWKQADRPLDTSAKHPFKPWAETIGGILTVNGLPDFLSNLARRKTADDPLRHALGLLGTERRDTWLTARAWADIARSLGLIKAVVSAADRDTHVGQERGLGVTLSTHRDETFAVETEDERLDLRLEKARRRFEKGAEPETR